MLVEALQQGGTAKDQARRQMMKALGLRNRGDRGRVDPTEADKSVEKHHSPGHDSGPGTERPQLPEEVKPYGDGTTVDDPYMTSPQPLRPAAENPLHKPKNKAQGTRLQIKMQGRAPSQPRLSRASLAEKLDEKRASAADAVNEIPDTDDEDMPIGNLPKSHREGG